MKGPGSFPGWTMPEGTFLPPEFGAVLPALKGSELKVLLVILERYLQPGIDARGLTYDEIQEGTGIKSRGTAVLAVRALLEYGYAVRQSEGRSFRYEPRLADGLKIRLQRMHALHDAVFDQSSQVVAYDHACDDDEILVRQMARDALVDRCGVARHVAENMAIGKEPALIYQHIDYALFAQEQGFIKKSLAAYVVASIRDNWQAPLNYKPAKKTERWFTDEEYELFFEHD